MDEHLSTDNPTLAHFGQMGEDHPTLVRGDGALVYDDAGTEYLDFSSQLYCVNAGHGNERILDAMRAQLEDVQYVSSAMDSDVRSAYARELVEVAPDSLSGVFFSVTGSDANEAAVQIAREVQDAGTVLTRWRSYHGSTYATAGLTGDPGMRAPIEARAGTTGNVKVLPPFAGCDAPFGDEINTLEGNTQEGNKGHSGRASPDSREALGRRAADHLEYVIKNQGPDSIAALLTEVVAGSSGAFTAPPGYFERVRELCDRYDILLAVDEVITGFGRCGDWFGATTEDLDPDLLTFAKGATSAYVPLAGVLTSAEIATDLRESQPGIGQTFAGNPVGCAAGRAALREYEDLIENVQSLSGVLETELRSLESYDVVGSVRGRGFLWGLEFVDPETGGPIFDPRVEEGQNPVSDVIDRAREKGVLVGAGRPGFQVMVAPPLCATEADLSRGVEVLDRAIRDVFGAE